MKIKAFQISRIIHPFCKDLPAMQCYFLLLIIGHIINNTGSFSSHKHSNALQLKYSRRSNHSLILKIKTKETNFFCQIKSYGKIIDKHGMKITIGKNPSNHFYIYHINVDVFKIK